MSSPSFDSLLDPQHGQLSGAGDHDALARQMIGERFARRPLALEGLDGLRPRRRLLGRQLIFGRRRLQLFELKLHLLQQPRLALRAAAVKLAAQLLDLELEMADQRFRARQVRLGVGRLGLGARRFGLRTCRCSLRARRCRLRFQARGALGKDHRMRGSKIGGERFQTTSHAADENHIGPRSASQILIQPTSAATSPVGVANRCRTTGNRAAPTRSSPRRRPGSATGSGPVPGAW